jgi:hypothetical protein
MRAAPVFPVGDRLLTEFAYADRSPDIMFATNGAALMRSSDYGCHWKAAYVPTRADPREAAPLPTISSLSVAGAGSHTTISFALKDTLDTVPLAAVRTSIVVSLDGGASWQAGSAGLPLGATVRSVEFDADRTTAYAVVDGPGVAAASAARLFRSADRGATWLPVVAAPDNPNGVLAGRASGQVWLWNAHGLFRSTNHATSFTSVAGIKGTVTSVGWPVGAATDAPPVVATTVGVFIGRDAAHWRIAPSLPANADSVAYDVANDVLVASTFDSLSVSERGVLRRIGPSTGERLRDLHLVGGQPDTVVGLSHAAIFVGGLGKRLGIVVKTAPPALLPVIEPVTLIPGSAPLVKVPTLSPHRLTVSLRPGQSRRVRYALDLPPTPTPLDVFFLIDTTNSLKPVIDGLRDQLAGIVNRLSALRINAQFGVGAFREYPVTAQGASATDNYAYRRIRRIGPVDDELEMALNALHTGGGTNDGRTSALAAEYQSVTGAGQSISPAGVNDGYAIPAGQDAGFRPEAMHLLLLVTDTEPRHDELGYPGPSVTKVGDTLAAQHVFQAGLVVGEPPSGVEGPRPIMQELAIRSGATAPDDGVDCDGDEFTDIEPGEPLVCDLAGEGLTGAIVEILRGIRDLAEVSVQVDGGHPGITASSALTFPNVNVKAYSRLSFDLSFSCRRGHPRESTMRMKATSRGRAFASDVAMLRCAPPVSAPKPPIPPPAPPAPIPHLNPQPHPNPNPNPNPNPQGQPQAQGQGGFAAQEEGEPQLAYVTEDTGPSRGEDLAMSTKSADDPPVPLCLAAVAILSGSAVGLRLRTAREPARQRG